MTTEQWTIERILNWTQGHFEKVRPDSPRLDAELLLAYVLDCTRLDLYLRADQPLNEKERDVHTGNWFSDVLQVVLLHI